MTNNKKEIGHREKYYWSPLLDKAVIVFNNATGYYI